jgi:hypothetical protein
MVIVSDIGRRLCGFVVGFNDFNFKMIFERWRLYIVPSFMKIYSLKFTSRILWSSRKIGGIHLSPVWRQIHTSLREVYLKLSSSSVASNLLSNRGCFK